MEKFDGRKGELRYKHTVVALALAAVAFWIANTPAGIWGLFAVSRLGYAGAFLAGMFFVSTFTAGPAGIVLVSLGKTLDPLSVALVAGAGSALGDYVILRFLRDKVFDELKRPFLRVAGERFARFAKTKLFSWIAPIAGALLIASPFPDEIGIALMGISKLKDWQFALVAFVLDALGIFAVVALANAV